MSPKNTASHQWMKKCSMVSDVLHWRQSTDQGTKIPFSLSHGLTGSVPLSNLKKNDLAAAGTHILFTRQSTMSCPGHWLYSERSKGAGKRSSTESRLSFFCVTVSRYSTEKRVCKNSVASFTSFRYSERLGGSVH